MLAHLKTKIIQHQDQDGSQNNESGVTCKHNGLRRPQGDQGGRSRPRYTPHLKMDWNFRRQPLVVMIDYVIDDDLRLEITFSGQHCPLSWVVTPQDTCEPTLIYLENWLQVKYSDKHLKWM